jgi:hypothetical protein
VIAPTVSLPSLAGGSQKQKVETGMNIDRAVLAFAGVVVLASLVLAMYVSPFWLALTAFAGLNMLQAAFTGFCPAALVFKKLGLKEGNAFR